MKRFIKKENKIVLVNDDDNVNDNININKRHKNSIKKS